jgi:hypothetical protein
MKTNRISREGFSIGATVIIPTDRNGTSRLSLPGDRDDRGKSKACFLRSFKGSLVGMIAAGTLAISCTSTAFAHGGGGGHGGGHFGGFGGHGFAPHAGVHSGQQYSHRGHFRDGGPDSYGGAYWDDDPYYGDYDYDGGEYSDGEASTSQVEPSEETIVGVQEALVKLGYYHGEVDGQVGPGTVKAIGWFQSVNKLAVTGRIDDPTLQALMIEE